MFHNKKNILHKSVNSLETVPSSKFSSAKLDSSQVHSYRTSTSQYSCLTLLLASNHLRMFLISESSILSQICTFQLSCLCFTKVMQHVVFNSLMHGVSFKFLFQDQAVGEPCGCISLITQKFTSQAVCYKDANQFILENLCPSMTQQNLTDLQQKYFSTNFKEFLNHLCIK